MLPGTASGIVGVMLRNSNGVPCWAVAKPSNNQTIPTTATPRASMEAGGRVDRASEERVLSTCHPLERLIACYRDIMQSDTLCRPKSSLAREPRKQGAPMLDVHYWTTPNGHKI